MQSAKDIGRAIEFVGSAADSSPVKKIKESSAWNMIKRAGAKAKPTLRAFELVRIARLLSGFGGQFLRFNFIDGLNIDRIGVMYGVHRGTVARWLVTIRGRLFDLAKGQLAAEHGLETADVRSLYRLLEPDLHVTMSRLLRDDAVNAG